LISSRTAREAARRLLGRAAGRPDDARHDLFRRAHRVVAEHSDLVNVVDQQSCGLLVGCLVDLLL
jgi:hypothetical protein